MSDEYQKLARHLINSSVDSYIPAEPILNEMITLSKALHLLSKCRREAALLVFCGRGDLLELSTLQLRLNWTAMQDRHVPKCAHDIAESTLQV